MTTTTSPSATTILSLAERSDAAAAAEKAAENWQASAEEDAYSKYAAAVKRAREAKADFDSAFASFLRTVGSRATAQSLLVAAAQEHPASSLAQQILARR